MARFIRFLRGRAIPLLLCLAADAAARDSSTPATPVTLNTPREFPAISSKADWTKRARDIREQVLISCGLWPLPEKTPLHAHVFGRIERDGYSIEKVWFETWPDFYLAGNLYRPLGHGRGPFPGVLNPHGHWGEGRFADNKDASIPGRCIGFARRGMVAFSYDMVGFNDTRFSDAPTNRPFYELHRQFGTNHSDELWNISLMGLQTWNSIRALDFLASLPDVNPKRLACTGESGGGTQTYILGAVDDRLAAQAPVVMVSHTMQGGCSCENAPGLRVRFSNMEIAAAAAPRPQILVGAAGDWTRDTLTVEGPAIQHVYELLRAGDRLRYVRFEFNHNYNQTSREAVYQWFEHWLGNRPVSEPEKETPFKSEPNSELRVFPDGRLPEGAVSRQALLARMRREQWHRWEQLAPKNKSSLQMYRKIFEPAWRHTFQLGPETEPARFETIDVSHGTTCDTTRLKLRTMDEAALEATLRRPQKLSKPARLVIVATTRREPAGQEQLALALAGVGYATVELDLPEIKTADPFSNFFTTYNLTAAQRQVRRIVATCAAARNLLPENHPKLVLIGQGHAGVYSILAAPEADAVLADCTGLASTDEQSLLEPEVFIPGLLAMGGFEGAALLAAHHPLLLHNTKDKFATDHLRAACERLNDKQRLRIEDEPLSEQQCADWVGALKF